MEFALIPVLLEVFSMLKSIKNMRGLLRVPKAKHNLTWARKLCEAGRDVHIDVWEMCLLNAFVEKNVLPLFAKSELALAKLKDLYTSRSTLGELRVYLHNNLLRSANITENYLQGKLSAFPPDSRISKIRARAS